MLLKILGIIADIVTIFSLWDVNGETFKWVKILCTVFLALIMVIVWKQERYVAKAVDYLWKDEPQPTLLVKRNKYFMDGSVVSIYMKEDNDKIPAAIGYVLNDKDVKYLQIKVFKIINDGAMRKIRINKTSYKKFFVKPYVLYRDKNRIDFRSTEEVENNV